jgi:hypothetical protein
MDHLNNKKMFTDYLCVKDGEIILVDIHIDVVLNKINKKSEDAINRKIVDIMDWFFDLPNWEFGQPLKEVDIIKALSEIKEASSFGISFITAQNIEMANNVISPKYNEVVRPDNININFTYKSSGE